MKYKIHNFFKMKNCILDNILMKGLGKMKPKDFTRNRKINATDIILYNMNNHRKTTKMELYDFIQKVEKKK